MATGSTSVLFLLKERDEEKRGRDGVTPNQNYAGYSVCPRNLRPRNLPRNLCLRNLPETWTARNSVPETPPSIRFRLRYQVPGIP